MKTQNEQKKSLSPKRVINTSDSSHQISKLDRVMKNIRVAADGTPEKPRVRYSINELDKLKIRNYIQSGFLVESPTNSPIKKQENKQEKTRDKQQEIVMIEDQHEEEEEDESKIECCDRRIILSPTQTYESNLPSLKFINYFKTKSIEWKSYKNNLVDSHCHFDMLFPKIKFNHSSINKYFDDFDCFYLKNFEACINVICNPRNYQTKTKLKSYLKALNHSKIYHSIGCHPHFADQWTQDCEDILMDALENDEKVVAIGECGIDLSKNNTVELKIQIEVFKIQLRIAAFTKMPIVIHCRDAEERCFVMLKEYLDPNHRIHLHCFTGSLQTAIKYMNTFNNLCIGVTPLITFKLDNPGKQHFKEMVKSLPLDRILLETDSPYFVPQLKDFPTSDTRVSHPGFIYATAECIAQINNVCINQVLDVNRRNVRKIYGF